MAEFPTTAVLDSFTRANETPLAAPWVSLIGFGKPNLVSNAVTGSGAAAQEEASQPSPSVNQEAYLTIAVLPAAAQTFQVWARAGGAGAGFDTYSFSVVSNTGAWTLSRVDNLTPTTLASGTLSGGAIVAGDQIGISAIGTLITGWYRRAGLAWTPLGPTVDATYQIPGNIGFSISPGSDTTYRLDDFGGGSADGGGPVDDRWRARRSCQQGYSIANLLLLNAYDDTTGLEDPSRDCYEDNRSRVL